jgi:hypothetical protein
MSQRDMPQLSLNNFTAGVRERENTNRTRVAGNRDEVEGVVASTLTLQRNGAVGFIDWLDPSGGMKGGGDSCQQALDGSLLLPGLNGRADNDNVTAGTKCEKDLLHTPWTKARRV